MQTHKASSKPYTLRSRGPSRRSQSLTLGTALVMSALKPTHPPLFPSRGGSPLLVPGQAPGGGIGPFVSGEAAPPPGGSGSSILKTVNCSQR